MFSYSIRTLSLFTSSIPSLFLSLYAANLVEISSSSLSTGPTGAGAGAAAGTGAGAPRGAGTSTHLDLIQSHTYPGRAGTGVLYLAFMQCSRCIGHPLPPYLPTTGC